MNDETTVVVEESMRINIYNGGNKIIIHQDDNIQISDRKSWIMIPKCMLPYVISSLDIIQNKINGV